MKKINTVVLSLAFIMQSSIAHAHEEPSLNLETLQGKWQVLSSDLVEAQTNDHEEHDHEEEASTLLSQTEPEQSSQALNIQKAHAGHDHLPKAKTKKFATAFFCTEEINDELQLFGTIKAKKLTELKKTMLISETEAINNSYEISITDKKNSLSSAVILLKDDGSSDDQLLISFDSGETYYSLVKKNNKVSKNCKRQIRKAVRESETQI